VIIYTYSEARQNLALLLAQASEEGEVKIRRRDGSVFIVKPEKPKRSPLDIKGIDLGISTAQIIRCIHEGRRQR
jgi:hypothetical protein